MSGRTLVPTHFEHGYTRLRIVVVGRDGGSRLQHGVEQALRGLNAADLSAYRRDRHAGVRNPPGRGSIQIRRAAVGVAVL